MRSSDRLRRSRPRLVGLGIAALLLSPGLAQATPSFPDVITRELQLQSPPPCSLCHAGGDTRRGTVTTPFGTTMRSRGLVAYSEDSLVNALKAITAEGKDSDGDGTSDVDELKAGSDPNLAAGESMPEPVQYGCASAEQTADPAGLAAALGAALAMAAVRRRRSSKT